MQETPKQSPGHAGLRCRKCGSQQFRVVYTRAAPGGKIVRRRECRACATHVTTWERAIGG
jgi:transcriptional regulator NrdR family protein